MDFGMNRPLLKPALSDTSQLALPSLPERHDRIPWPDMPEKMLVVIDGWTDMPKVVVGHWVAKGLGALFVNSEDFYLALVQGCLMAGVDLENTEAVRAWCARKSLDIGFADDRDRGLRAEIAVNGHWFSKLELDDARGAVEKSCRSVFQAEVTEALSRCEFEDRVVVTGTSIGGTVFPRTPYKFFLDKPGATHADRELITRFYPVAGDSHPYVASGMTCFDHVSKTLMIDTSQAAPWDVVKIVLVESAARAFEMGFLGAPLETVISDAVELGDQVRREMYAILANRAE
jgi:cytidylate kinase